MIQSDPIKEILGFEINLNHFILDPLYGPVGLTDKEFELINTAPFRRLRDIKQLGFAFNVYPGATHSRFEHSIGTLHTTWTMLKRFLRNYTNQSKWRLKRPLRYLSEDVVRSARFAALTHDLGHGPFSHILENVARSLLVEFDHDKLTLFFLSFALAPRYTSNILPKSLDTAIKSEKTLSKTLYKLRKSLTIIPEKQRRTALAILDEDFQSKYLTKGFMKIRSFLTSLIKGDIGSDRIDYLLRDTYFAGLGHRFNFSDILDNIRGIYDKDKDRLILCFDRNGRHAVEFLLTTRYYHYRLIAHHPQNIFEQMKFQKRLQEHMSKNIRKSGTKRRRHQNEISRIFMEVSLKEDSVEKTLPPNKLRSRQVGIWKLGDIRTSWYRYLFYRLIEDAILRREYAERIKRNICSGVKRFVNHKTSLRERDLHVEFIVEKPHIPILQEYRLIYLVKKRFEDEKYSSLLHDHSLLLRGLARAYLSDASMIVYSDVSNYPDVLKYTQKTHHFFLDSKIFKDILKGITAKEMLGHDLLLVGLYLLSNLGRHYIKGIGRFFNSIEGLQQKYCGKELYDFATMNCYDPEYKESFRYPEHLFNDLLLLDVSKLVRIDNKTQNVSPPKAKPFYVMSYYLFPIIAGREVGLSGPSSPLRNALSHYPSTFLHTFGLAK